MLTVEVREGSELRALLTAWEIDPPVSPEDKANPRRFGFECYQPGLRLVEGDTALLPAEGALTMAKRLIHRAQWTSGKVGTSPEEEDRVEHLINHIRDQVAKRQYLNATSWSVELVAELQRRLNGALKGGAG